MIRPRIKRGSLRACLVLALLSLSLNGLPNINAFISKSSGRNHMHLFSSRSCKGKICKPGFLNKNTDNFPFRDNWNRKVVIIKATNKQKFKTFEDFLLQHSDSHHGQLTLVTFASPACGPCKKMKEELVTVKESIGDLVTMATVDSNKYPSLSSRYEITGKFKD